MTLDPTYLSSFFLIGTAFGAAFTVALWLSLIFWTYRDIRKRARDPFMVILGVLIVALLFLPGILIYLIIRPSRTIEEEYQRTLEEEALLQTIEDNPLCSGCCSRLLEIPWDLCPYCAVPAPGNIAEIGAGQEPPPSQSNSQL
jgi:hypothetical protein